MARILVIDDHEHIRLIIQALLTNEGHTVDIAEDGKVGLKMAGEADYQLVITDIMMPNHDGLEVVTKLKRSVPGIGLIVITGGGPTVDLTDLTETAKILGADHVLTKVLDFELLREVTHEVLTTYGYR